MTTIENMAMARLTIRFRKNLKGVMDTFTSPVGGFPLDNVDNMGYYRTGWHNNRFEATMKIADDELSQQQYAWLLAHMDIIECATFETEQCGPETSKTTKIRMRMLP